jgi:tRNA A37 methylthiotransferase MiaB
MEIVSTSATQSAKVLFCQFSTNLINKDVKKDVADVYYTSIYDLKGKDGYFKGADFWEIPLWIAEIAGCLKGFNKELYIIKDIQQAQEDLNNKEVDYILFSALDVNKQLILEIAKNYTGKAKIVIGGYVDFKIFEGLNNVIILNTIKGLAEYLNIKYIYDLDYTLFKGMKTIPRLTLSTGCLNVCKFCTQEKIINEKNVKDVIKQVKSYKDLNFELIYLNDKTFGQAKNYILLKGLTKTIKRYNPAFKGFIIQTTTSQFLQNDFVKNIKDLNIFAVELGIESYNNEILAQLRKPQNTKVIDKAINIIKGLGIKIIPNFMIGLIGESKDSYINTLTFISEHMKDFYILNIYNLAIYENTELAKEVNFDSTDSNELDIDKSFYNKEQKENNKYFYNCIFKIGLEILRQG